MDRKLIAICMLSLSAMALMIANFSIPAQASTTTNSRDYQLSTALMQNGSEGLYVLDNRTGLIAIFTYDYNTRTLRRAPSVRSPTRLDNKRPMQAIRHDWTKPEIRDLYEKGLLDLVFSAAALHRKFHDPAEVQVCKLISIKTGACPEDCAYCAVFSISNRSFRDRPLACAGSDGDRRAGEGFRRQPGLPGRRLAPGEGQRSV